MRSQYVRVRVDLDRVRAAAERIRRTVGVPLIAVIKADAYGLGARPVARALTGVADEFAYFTLREARTVGRPGLVLGPPDGDPAEYRARRLRPAVGNVADAERLRGVPVAINLDTGMQRFGCRPEELDDLRRRCHVTDIFTHAVTSAAARALRDACAGGPERLHAACTALLDCREAWLDAVRPGLALYRGAVRVSTRLHCARQTHGPIGYTGVVCPRVGVILAGYSNHVQPGPVLVNGRRQEIIEVGMNTSFVTLDPADTAGAEVVLLGDGLSEADLAAHFHCREHEILCRYTAMGRRAYVGGGTAAC